MSILPECKMIDCVIKIFEQLGQISENKDSILIYFIIKTTMRKSNQKRSNKSV